MSDDNEREMSFSSLLEEDRKRLTGEIDADRSVAGTSKVLENEIDRLMLRYSQGQVDRQRLSAARQMMQTVKTSLPVVESVNDVEVWQKEKASGSDSFHVSIPGLIILAAGAGLTIVPSLTHPGTILCTVIGAACLLLGGFLVGRGSAKRGGQTAGDSEKLRRKADSQRKFLVDAESAYHIMKQMTVTVDHLLEEVRIPEDSTQKPEQRSPDQYDPLPADIDFYAELLEDAYSLRQRNPEDRMCTEQIESIRYYLHSRGIDAADFTDESNRNSFEFLPPGGGKMTLRPALMKDGKLLKRGLASD